MKRHLLGREIDIRVATDVMGWGDVGESHACSACISEAKLKGNESLESLRGELCGSYISEGDAELNKQIIGRGVLPARTHERVPNYHENSYAVEKVEARIHERGLDAEYEKALDELTNNHPLRLVHPDEFGQEALKTHPNLRCYAALLAVGSSIDIDDD